jgi:hypothetical protein
MASLWAWLEQESSTLSPPQASLDRKESGLHLYTTSKCRLEQKIYVSILTKRNDRWRSKCWQISVPVQAFQVQSDNYFSAN